MSALRHTYRLHGALVDIFVHVHNVYGVFAGPVTCLCPGLGAVSLCGIASYLGSTSLHKVSKHAR